MTKNGAGNVFSNLTTKQRRAMEALLSGADKEEAAAVAGVSLRTVDRWHNEPAFYAALNHATGRALGNLARLMVDDMHTARRVLRAICEDETASRGVRIRAAVALLRYGRELHDETVLLARVEALEERV